MNNAFFRRRNNYGCDADYFIRIKNMNIKSVNNVFTESISIDEIDAFIFDFDGVLTNNLVHLDQDGREWVSCSRADGLAFDVLRILKKPAYSLSTEKNSVVSARAEKLKIPAIQGVSDKVLTIKDPSCICNINILNLNYLLFFLRFFVEFFFN